MKKSIKAYLIYEKSLKYKELVNKVMIFLTTLMILIIAIISFLQVIARFVGSPFFWTEEVSRIMLIYLSFIGAAIVLNRREHLSINIFIRRARGKLKKIMYFIIDFLMLFFSIALTVYSIQMMKATMNMLTPLGFPRGFMYIALIIGGILMSIEIIFRFFEDLFESSEKG